MKLHASGVTALNAFTAYGTDHVMVNNVRHSASMVVMPEAILPWRPRSFDGLMEEDFALLAPLGLEVLLLGTGARQRFPHPRLTRALSELRVGVEVMDLQAACRTYNILLAEQRKVAAALLFEQDAP